MVTLILDKLRFYLALLAQVALLFYAIGLRAEPLELAPGLKLTLPDTLALAVIAAPDSAQFPVVMGELNGEPGYFLAATKIKAWEKNAILWRRLETNIGKRAEGNSFTLLSSGSFQSDDELKVFFRGYEYRVEDQTRQQVYFLLNTQRAGYWLTLTAAENVDIKLAIPIASALVRRARIAD